MEQWSEKGAGNLQSLKKGIVYATDEGNSAKNIKDDE